MTPYVLKMALKLMVGALPLGAILKHSPRVEFVMSCELNFTERENFHNKKLFGNLWRSSVILGNRGRSSEIFGDLWQTSAIFGDPRGSSVIFGYLWIWE